MSHDHTHEHSHDHDHSHHHHSHDHHSHDHHSHDHHSHDHGPGGEMSMEEKLNTLFSHWINHNDSHKDNFFSWAEKAREAGLTEVAQALEEAAGLSDKVTEKLKQAHALI